MSLRIVCIVGSAIVILSLGVVVLKTRPAASQPQIPAKGGEISPKAKEPEGPQEFYGVLRAHDSAQYKGSPAVQSPVTKIHKKVDDRVKAGDLLITLDPAPHPIERAKALLVAAERKAQVASLELARAKAQCERCVSLEKRQTISQEEIEVCKTAVVAKEHLVAAAQAEVSAAKSDLAIAEYQNSLQFLKAPIAGLVVEMNVACGMVARPESGPVVWAWVVDDSVLVAEVFVSLEISQKLDRKKPAQVIQGTSKLEGAIELIGPMADWMGRIPVRVRIPNPSGELRIGTSVKVVFGK